ncbi:hypothetical protein HY844_01065 [Candidatus Berkelbacteria bacterium]|nr:hypothetical protein [Candidatus Berkelbacteria bacterium]
MKSKIEQVNIGIKKALPKVIYPLIPDLQELEIVDVLIDPSYDHGRVWLKTSVESFNEIKSKRVDIQNQLSRFVKLRKTPKLTFIIDDRYLDHIDNLFNKIEDEN